MSRNPLLPDRYTDASLQASILYALRPYVITDRSDIVNPQMKWNLQKAWNEAEDLFAKSIWKQREADGTYELSADTDHEIDNLNTIIAGVMAHEIMHPDEGLYIRRVEHRRGGEVALIIASSAADALQEMFPMARYIESRKP